jgi:hypothetical protein
MRLKIVEKNLGKENILTEKIRIIFELTFLLVKDIIFH